MNLFILDENPQRAAAMLSDMHVNRTLTDATHLLFNELRRQYDVDGPVAPLRNSAERIDIVRWLRGNVVAFIWLHDYALALAAEFEKRFGNAHRCVRDLPIVTRWLDDTFNPSYLESTRSTGPVWFCLSIKPKVYPDLIQKYGIPHDGYWISSFKTAVLAYRAYYIRDKAVKATWIRGTPAPDWWPGDDDEEPVVGAVTKYGSGNAQLVLEV